MQKLPADTLDELITTPLKYYAEFDFSELDGEKQIQPEHLKPGVAPFLDES